jgi:hypothetical protein
MLDLGFQRAFSLWRAPHSPILNVMAATRWMRYVSRVRYELATLPYLYSLRVTVIADETTDSYQHVSAKSEAAVSDWVIRQRMTFREVGPSAHDL